MFKISIFIPVYYRDELVKHCLTSLKYTDTKDLHVTLNLGLNGARQSFIKDFLESYISEVKGTVFADVNVFDPGENIGKGKMVNHMARTLNDFDYLVSIDSDMEMIDGGWLKNFINIFTHADMKIGALCSNQINNSFHKISDCKKVVIEKFSVVCTPGNIGIAGGVMITPFAVWANIGGYKANKIFGNDDTTYATDCFIRGLVMGYVDEIEFFHPKDDDIDYLHWKSKAKSNKLNYYENDGYYEVSRYE